MYELFLNIITMKMQRPRINQSIPLKTQSSDPTEFLTFRNTPSNVENTGRSLYSQQFQYRSLQKCTDIHQIDERGSETHQNLSRKYLKNVKSSEKVRLYSQIPMKAIDQNHQFQIQMERKNQDLKKQLAKILKNIKKQQRKQIIIDKEIQEQQKLSEEVEQEISEQNKIIEELEEIQRENKEDLEKLYKNYKDTHDDNECQTERVQKIEDSIESNQVQNETSRQDDYKNKSYFQQLKDGWQKLEIYHKSLCQQAIKIQQEIEKMQEYLQEISHIDSSFKKISEV